MIPPFQLTKNRVAIIGLHPDTKLLAPWDDPAWEVWSANEYLGDKFGGFIKHSERHFQLHTPDIWRRKNNWNDTEHEAWLQNFPVGKPLYMQEVYPDIPASVKYPLEEIKAKLGLDERTTFFSCTAAHQIAFALYLGAKTIGMWGVEANSSTEYGNERDSLSFWLGVVKGMGVEMVLPGGCTLLGAGRFIYGYEGLAGIKASTLQKRLETHVKDTEAAATVLAEKLLLKQAAVEAARGFKSASKDVWAAHMAAMEALARVNLARGIQLEDEQLLATMLAAGMEILTSVMIDQRKNQFGHQVETLQARLNESMGRRIESVYAMKDAKVKGEQKRLGKRVMKLDAEVADMLAQANLVQGVVAEDQALLRIADGMTEDIKPPVEQLLIRMQLNQPAEEKPPGPTCKNHLDRPGNMHYKGYSLCTECFDAKEKGASNDD